MKEERWIILYRNPNGNRVGAIMDDKDDRIATFASEREAEECAHGLSVCQAWPYSIVEAP